MDSNQIIFYFISGFTLATALLILLTKSMIRAVFLLMLVFIGVAVIYFISGAEFVGVTQIMIYVGGILILMMFGVMLTARVDGNKSNDSSDIGFGDYGHFIIGGTCRRVIYSRKE